MNICFQTLSIICPKFEKIKIKINLYHTSFELRYDKFLSLEIHAVLFLQFTQKVKTHR